jgi:putative transcriptional regulator
MTIMHHPSSETLFRFAAGTLSAGPAVVVASHVAGCSACQAQLRAFEAVGGVFLDDAPPVPMGAGAVDAALASIERPQAAAAPRTPRRFRAPLPSSILVPQALRDRDVGPWRWLAPGVRASRVAVPEDKTAFVFLIKVAPGKKVPEHGHTGLEFTHVLAGSFKDAQGRYLPGDTLEADADIDHQPMVDSQETCICLAAVEGAIRLHGVVGHILRPFIGA